MTNHPREEDLALYSTGDLDGREIEWIAAHLEGCGECRNCLAELKQMAVLLASASDEPSAEDLSDVRQRVLRRIEGARPRRRSFHWAAAVAGLAALVLLARFERRPAVEVPPAPARIATVQPPGVTASAAVLAKEAVVVRRRPRRQPPGLRSIALVMKSGEEPLIKITTSDPRVIILLPPDTQHDERTESND